MTTMHDVIFVIWAKRKIREMKDKMTSHLSLLSSSTSIVFYIVNQCMFFI